MDISFTDIVETINRLHDATSVSLPQFTKPATIESPCFIQDSLFEDTDVINDVIKNLYNVYTGYVLSALQMNDLVSGHRRVRDILGTVSTGSLFGSVESFADSRMISTGFKDLNEDATSDKTISSGRTSHTRFTEKEIPPIASGRIIELKFATANGDPISVMVHMKFNTRLVPDEVMSFVVDSNFSLDVAKRWLQVRAGEIRFFKDFVLNLDKLEKRAKALRSDKSNALGDILRHQNKGNLRSSFKLLHLAGANRSYNLANSVIMFDDQFITPVAKKAGLNFDKVEDRRKFFSTTFALFIVMIDQRYSKVKLYINGVDDVATFSFTDLRRAAASDKTSIRDIMDYLSKNQAPKF